MSISTKSCKTMPARRGHSIHRGCDSKLMVPFHTGPMALVHTWSMRAQGRSHLKYRFEDEFTSHSIPMALRYEILRASGRDDQCTVPFRCLVRAAIWQVFTWWHVEDFFDQPPPRRRQPLCNCPLEEAMAKVIVGRWLSHWTGYQCSTGYCLDRFLAENPSQRYMATSALQHCSICLAELTNGQHVRLLSACEHLFHRRCVDRWLAKHTKCPMCRTKIITPNRMLATVGIEHAKVTFEDGSIELLRSNWRLSREMGRKQLKPRCPGLYDQIPANREFNDNTTFIINMDYTYNEYQDEDADDTVQRARFELDMFEDYAEDDDPFDLMASYQDEGRKLFEELQHERGTDHRAFLNSVLEETFASTGVLASKRPCSPPPPLSMCRLDLSTASPSPPSSPSVFQPMVDQMQVEDMGWKKSLLQRWTNHPNDTRLRDAD